MTTKQYILSGEAFLSICLIFKKYMMTEKYFILKRITVQMDTLLKPLKDLLKITRVDIKNQLKRSMSVKMR